MTQPQITPGPITLTLTADERIAVMSAVAMFAQTMEASTLPKYADDAWSALANLQSEAADASRPGAAHRRLRVQAGAATDCDVMADQVKCDKCQRSGPRRIGTIAPEGWLYATVRHDETDEVAYIFACSIDCTQLTWTPGPGRLSDPDVSS